MGNPIFTSFIAFILCTTSFAALMPQKGWSTAASNKNNSSMLQTMQNRFSKQIRLFRSPQYAGFVQLINKIPLTSWKQYAQLTSMGVYLPEPKDYDYTINFTNWGETVQLAYDHILYPSDFAPIGGKQITSIQQLVVKASQQGKRVRGSGLRHSWSNIFADPEQYLVSFFPADVVHGTTTTFNLHSNQVSYMSDILAGLNFEHLNQIKKIGEIQILENNKNITKHLVKIGSAVSNLQLKEWGLKNKYQIRSNAVMVQINFVGALCTCSHGAGKNTQTLCDYVNQIQFIDSNGKRQTISKKDNPKLLKSAASALGLLGIVIFVTVEMQDIQIVRLNPRTTYKDFSIPWPKDYPNEKKQQRMQRPEYQQWLKGQNSSTLNKMANWSNNVNNLITTINSDHCEWFYFPAEGTNIFQNTWNIYSKKTPQNIAKIAKQEINAKFIDNYPLQSVQRLSELAQSLQNILQKNEQTQILVAALLKSPFMFFPKQNIFVNYPDAIHFQRGTQNIQFRTFQCEINIPLILINGQTQIDYDLIQKVWWATLEIVQQEPAINIDVQMRVFRGSNATLAPQFGFDYVCSIEVIRTSILDANTEKLWKNIAAKMFNAWKALTDSNGKQVTLRPHWGKEWDHFPQVKQHLLQDEGFKQNLRTFLKDYKEIAALKNFSYERNLFTFSNKVYRELLNSAIQMKESNIN